MTMIMHHIRDNARQTKNQKKVFKSAKCRHTHTHIYTKQKNCLFVGWKGYDHILVLYLKADPFGVGRKDTPLRIFNQYCVIVCIII